MIKTLKAASRSLVTAIQAALASATFDMTSATSVRVPTPDNAASAVPRSYLESSLATLSAGFVLKGTARVAVVAASLAALGGTYDAGAKTITLTAGALPTIDAISDLAVGQKAFFQFTGSNKARSGLYDYTTAGDTGVSAVFTRSSVADESAELTTGAMYLIREGTTYGGRYAYIVNLSSITLDTTAIDVSFSPAGSGVTQGDGIGVSGSVVSVRFATDPGLEVDGSGNLRAKVAGPLSLTSNGIEIGQASEADRGTLSAADKTAINKLPVTVVAEGSTTDDGTFDLNLPALAVDTMHTMEVEVIARSETDPTMMKSAIYRVAASRGSSGASEVGGDSPDELSDLYPASDIAGVALSYVAGSGGSAGSDKLRVTGIPSHTINHKVIARVRYL